ncbi:MAG: hypothetical protein OEZ65_14445 [Gemmatimonadota bacterium]|nr:hypothetical protein [Gemmatimonadota bacterium]
MNVKIRVIALAAMGAGISSSAAGQASSSLGVELGVRNHHVVAGMPFAAGSVTRAAATGTSGRLTLGGLVVYDHDLGDFGEADVFAQADVELTPGLAAFVGGSVNNFNLVGGWQTTFEAFAGLAVAAPMNPVVMVVHDFDIGDGTHALLAVGHDVSMGPVTLSTSASLGYNRSYYSDTSGFAYADAGVAAALPFSMVTLTPSVTIQRAIADTFQHLEIVGLTASVTF